MTRKNFVSIAVAIVVILLSQIAWEAWAVRWHYAPIPQSINVLYHHLNTVLCARVQIVLEAFPSVDYMLLDKVFFFRKGRTVGISPGCSGLKQYFHFICLIMCSLNGSFRQRVCYIFSGVLVLFNFNVLRISVLCVMMQHTPHHWEFFHSTFFRFAFYVIILLLWILWEESRCLSGSSLKKKENDYC